MFFVIGHGSGNRFGNVGVIHDAHVEQGVQNVAGTVENDLVGSFLSQAFHTIVVGFHSNGNIFFILAAHIAPGVDAGFQFQPKALRNGVFFHAEALINVGVEVRQDVAVPAVGSAPQAVDLFGVIAG